MIISEISAVMFRCSPVFVKMILRSKAGRLVGKQAFETQRQTMERIQSRVVQTSAVVKRLTVRYPTAHGGFRFQLDGFVFPFFLFFFIFIYLFFFFF